MTYMLYNYIYICSVYSTATQHGYYVLCIMFLLGSYVNRYTNTPPISCSHLLQAQLRSSLHPAQFGCQSPPESVPRGGK